MKEELKKLEESKYEDFGDELLNSGFTPFNISELDKESILDEDIFNYVLSVEDNIQKTRILVELQNKAKELKVIRAFDKLFKAYQTNYVQRIKGQGSNIIQFTNPPLKDLKCGKWICKDTGVTKTVLVNFESQIVVACPHPILPVERLINVDTNIEKVKLAFYKDNKWQTIIAERNTIASKSKILQLANVGIEVNDNNAKELITYLSEVINLNVQEIPILKGITHLGWVENEFVPYTNEYKYDGESSFETIYKNVKTKGDYDVWKNEIKKLRKESETLHFIIAASFASPLIELLHINPFIVHLWGKSGTGKTVALMVAMSVWGNPEVGQLVKNLNSTSVGLERLSTFLKNIPFAGDELQAIKNKFTDFNELIYRLTQGEGRSRGTVDGGLAEQGKWSCAFLTTGEEPITSDYSKEGVKNRVIEIEENEKIVTNGNEVVNILIDNYGHAGKEFVQNIPNTEELKKQYKEICEELKNKYSTTDKQINTIATVILADRIISKLIFNDEPLKIEDVKKCFTEDVDEADRIYQKILDWFYQNINKFRNDSYTGEVWGKYEQIGEGITEIYIIPKVLRDFLSDNNVSFDGIKRKLFDKGYIEKDTENKYSQSQRINGTLMRCIKIIVKPDINNKQISLETMEELPF